MKYDDSIDRSFDNQLTPEDWEALQRAVIEDPEIRRAYVEQRYLHAWLESQSEILPSLFAASEPRASAQRPIPWIGFATMAAALVLFGVSLFLFYHGKPDPIIATLIEAKDCRWAGSDLPTVEGAGLSAGTLALTEGIATIRFKSGATVTLEAPSVLEVESAMKCRLVEGSVVADVPKSAHGFTIDTAQMEVIDLGTRFGVTSNSLGQSNVFVFEGEVKVKRDTSPGVKHVFAGGALVGDLNSNHDQEVRRSEPATSPGPDWTAISTNVGQGWDTYLRRGDSHGPTGSHPLLMVKHTDLAENNERRAVLAFDLSSLAQSEVLAAKLSLKIEQSGLGFSSLVPDSRFAIYGVIAPQVIPSDESELLWSNAGPLTEETISPSIATRLASFEIHKGAPTNLVEVASEEFTHFLQSQKGGVVMLLLIRETSELDRQGLVHAFASREHPTAPAPTLWIQTATTQ